MLPLPLPSVVFQRVDDGAVLFSPDTELYFGLNEVGARVWELLPPTCTQVDDVVARLAAVYPDAAVETIRADVVALLGQLQLEGLVTTPTGADADAPG